MTFWMRSAPMHWQWICIREITMRWQGRSFHPNTSTAGSQLFWATPRPLHNSPASWQYLTVHSCKPKDLCCANPGLGGDVSCLWFDETGDKENSLELREELNRFTVQPHVSARGGIQACVIVLLTYYDDVRGGCHTGTSPLSEKVSAICQIWNAQVESNLCWLPFTVENAPDWNVPELTKRRTGHLAAFAGPNTHLHPWSIMAISCVDNTLSLIVWKCVRNEDAERLKYSRAILCFLEVGGKSHFSE